MKLCIIETWFRFSARIAKFSCNAPSEFGALILLTLLACFHPPSLVRSLPSGLITFSGRWVCFVGGGGRGGRAARALWLIKARERRGREAGKRAKLHTQQMNYVAYFTKEDSLRLTDGPTDERAPSGEVCRGQYFM